MIANNITLSEYDEKFYEEDRRASIGWRSFQFAKLERLPDEERRVNFVACFFWRSLASQAVYTYLPQEHYEFGQRLRIFEIQGQLRKRVEWILTEAERVMPPYFIANLIDRMDSSMDLLIERSIRSLCKDDFEFLRRRLLVDHKVNDWQVGPPLMRAAFKALTMKLQDAAPPVQQSIFPQALGASWQQGSRWLMELSPDLPPQLLLTHLPELWEWALVYPGAGRDWSPLRQFNRVLNSFVFFDPACFRGIREQLNSTWSAERLFPNTSGAQLVGAREFDLTDLVSEPVKRSLRARLLAKLGDHYEIGSFLREPADHLNEKEFLKGSVVWAVFEPHGRFEQRVSLLYFEHEAIMGMAWLKLLTRHSPKALVLEDHGLGGNIWWQNFGQSYHILLMQRLRMAAPRYLVVGNDRYGFVQNTGIAYENLGQDLCWEAVSRNFRTVYGHPARIKR